VRRTAPRRALAAGGRTFVAVALKAMRKTVAQAMHANAAGTGRDSFPCAAGACALIAVALEHALSARETSWRSCCCSPGMRLRGQHFGDAQPEIHIDVNHVRSRIKGEVRHMLNDHGPRHPPAAFNMRYSSSPNSFEVSSTCLPARSTHRSTRSSFKSATENTAAAGKWLLRKSARIRADSSAKEKGLPM
jgi:hypothetical protein